jgi:excisionase family DNA binding protein
MTEKLLLTMTEAAEVLSISRSRIYELTASGELEFVKLGKSRRVPVDAIESLIARLREVNA